ncbi:NAD(P)/FAD-dependent oxidoreductase [Streptomyces sp. NPDC001315]|uniref:NAD(P)/FAD-dependent oxidoreductase n=1 Tax=Streptomyces sp. NPDC001315 TaxID=3364562 RepID=UPI003682D35E
MSIQRLVVVGASLAGLRAVEAARATGFRGSVTLIGAEPDLPYDRTALSKSFLELGAEPAVPYYRDADSYRAELGVDLRLGAPATGLDTDRRTVEVDGTAVPYDRLIIATGVRARTLADPVGLAGVHTLRTVQDARRLRHTLDRARRVVVVGAGFVGAEAASAARARGAAVTVLDAAPAPLARSVGPRLGARVSALHAAHGTVLRCPAAVDRIEGTDRVERVVLTDGTVLPADLVVVGVGAEPAVEWCRDSAVTLDNGVVCDETLATTAPGVYAAGDAARWYNPLFGRTMRLEHWTSAAEQGTLAARNALSEGPGEACATVPYFWSDWYGNRIQFLGVPDPDGTELFGDLGGHRYVALYRTGDRLGGVLAVNRKADIVRYRKLLRRGTSWQQAIDLAARHEAEAAQPVGGAR